MAKSGGSWNRFEYARIHKKIASSARGVGVASTKHAHEFVVQRWKDAREVRSSIGIWLIAVGILIIAVIAQSILARGVYSEASSIRGGTYAEGLHGRIDTLNPLFASTQAEQSAGRLLFSSLFNYDESGELSADLATGYKVSEDGKTYTVTVRDDALWHDGNPVTVDDVIYTVELMKDAATGSPLAASWSNIEVEKANAESVAFTLSSAYAPFPHALTFAVLPSHILKGVSPGMLREHSFSSEPVGSGPFTFRFIQQVQGAETHSVAHLRQNTAYYGGVVKLDRLQLHAYESKESLAEGLRTHAINAASGIALESVHSFEDNRRFHVQSLPVRAGVYTLLNTKSELLKERAVRKALQLGTNVDTALEVLPWKTKRLDGPFIEGQVETTAQKPGYNLETAKKLLDEADWKLGSDNVRTKDGTPLEIRLVYLKNTDYEGIANELVRQWGELGVRVQTQSIDASDPSQNFVGSILRPRNFDVLLHELTIGADPDIYAYWHSSQASARGLNFTGFSDDIGDDALASARASRDESLRKAKYESFLERWYAEAPAIGLYQSAVPYITTGRATSVDGGATYVSETDRYRNVVDWTVRSGMVFKTP